MSRRSYKPAPKAPPHFSLSAALPTVNSHPAWAKYLEHPGPFASEKSARVDYGNGTPNTDYSTILPCTDTVTLRFSPQQHASCLLLDFISPTDGTRIETALGITVWEVFNGQRYKMVRRGSHFSKVELYYINPNLGYEVHSTTDDRFIMPFSFRVHPKPVAEPPIPHPYFD